MVFCGKCGTKAVDDALFCPNCGNPLIQRQIKVYCTNCGSQIDEEAIICPNCGVQQKEIQEETSANDDGSPIWAILGFLIPLVGFILWIVWKDDKPKNARMAGFGALGSITLEFVIAMAFLTIIAILNVW